jgi:hypothetical protein
LRGLQGITDVGAITLVAVVEANKRVVAIVEDDASMLEGLERY